MIRYSTLSRPGTRKSNEDCLAVYQQEPAFLAVLADGLGGHGGGDIASRVVTESCGTDFSDYMPANEASVRMLIENAQERLLQAQEEHRTMFGMRTTMTVLLADGKTVAWGHVGDSRIYRFNGGSLAEQTLDHSVPQMLVMTGDITPEQIRHHPDRNRLLKAMGVEWAGKPYTLRKEIPCEAGDAYLLCSDGFWENILEDQMARTLAEAGSPEDWLGRMEKIALEQAGDREMDNYSAIAVWT